MIPARVPPAARPALEEYLHLVDESVPGFLAGFYLHGSIALGAFDPARSDVDFLAVVSRRAGDAELVELAAIHRALRAGHPACVLEGSYLQWADLGCRRDVIVPAPCYDGRSLHRAGHSGLNPVTWWILKRHGLAVLGPEPASLPFEIAWDAVARYTRANLETYWAGWASNPWRLVKLMSAWGVEWAVLGVSRLLYALREGDIPSKIQAGEYALAHAPARWRQIVQEALAIRRGARGSCYGSRLARAGDAVGYLKYAIAAGRGAKPDVLSPGP